MRTWGSNKDSWLPNQWLRARFRNCENTALLKGQKQQKDFRQLLDAMRAAVWFLDRWGRVVDCNRTARALGPFKEADGKSLLELSIDDADPAERHREVMQVIRTGVPMLNVPEKLELDGVKRWYSVDKIPAKDSESGVSGLLLIYTDITERKQYLRKLEHQANHDSLTLLPNRNGLYREMERQLEMRKPDQLVGLLLIDLDRFREINDTLGHHAGDKLLKQIGPRLERLLSGRSGMVARLGGDEFAILLPQLKSAEQATALGQRFLEAIHEEFDLEGFKTEVSASIGVSLCPDQASDISTLMRYADVAMYYAKSEMLGVSVYNSDHDPHSPKRLALISDLGRAIREAQLRLDYQPKIDLASGRVYGAEALLRWQHPALGTIPPGDFIPLAESTNLIHPITLWVLDRSIAQCAHWHRHGQRLGVAVNLSVRNLLDERIAEQVEELLNKYRLEASWLELEITESAMMVDPARAMAGLEKIHNLGVQLSIDDFGTGYSSLAYLKRLPVQWLKIDYSFVVNMLEDEQDEVIVNSTINLAHNLRLRVVAEGVENEAVLARLKTMGCDAAQGFHIGRPVAATDTIPWLQGVSGEPAC